jgi:AcrR family transcriptional regulator
MSVRESRRAAALDRVVDHMLQHGVAVSSVRALARAAGTSDRMLFYYFTDKDDIVVSALQTIGARFAAILTNIIPQEPRRSPEILLAEFASVILGPQLRPYMRLWLEVVIYASRGEEPYLTVSGRIADGFVALVAGMIDHPDEAGRQAKAARLIAILDGAILLDLAGRKALAELALTRS